MDTDLVGGDYGLAWLVYGAGGLVLMVIVWRLSRGMVTRSGRDLLRAMAFVLLAIPAQVPAYPGMYAPAWMVALSETVLQEHGNPLPALALLLSGAVALSLALVLLRWRGEGGRGR